LSSYRKKSARCSWEAILALLQTHPEELTPDEIQQHLGESRRLVHTCLGMLRYGLVQRVRRGRYVVM
jgi:DNA-binding IclR family transcriptional regulator